MRQSQTPELAPERRVPRLPSASTAAGIAAERVARADRERARRTSRARTAARHLDDRPASR
jgi:hypothetical protein